jgi:stress-induced morphogen
MPSQFDERPTEPVPEETQKLSAKIMSEMRGKIQEALKAEFVEVKDAYGDGRHVSIDVVSAEFEGKSAVQRQRLVYKAIWYELANLVHAVDAMTTKTPEEAKEA